jgi:23S rRNA pseudouridine2457 synthase
MPRYLAFFKPYEVLSQFTDSRGRATLKDYIPIPEVYPAGRLDYRSEGLLILSDDGAFIRRLSDPRFEHPKTYLVQVEGVATNSALQPLRERILLPDLQTKTIQVEIIPEPNLPPRSKPVRLYHPTTWLKVILQEGKKHQVRRLTATVGYPTLRLVRVTVASITLGDLLPGTWRWLGKSEIAHLFR